MTKWYQGAHHHHCQNWSCLSTRLTNGLFWSAMLLFASVSSLHAFTFGPSFAPYKRLKNGKANSSNKRILGIEMTLTPTTRVGKGSCSITRTDASANDETFDYKSIDDRLDFLERSSPEAMAGFYEAHLQSFSVRPGTEVFSVTSTLFALESFEAATSGDYASAGALFATVADLELKSGKNTVRKSGDEATLLSSLIPIQEVLEETLMAEWNAQDLFQVPLIIHILLTMDPNRVLFNASYSDSKEKKERMKILVQALLDARPLRRSGQTQALSEHLMFLVARAMSTINGATATNETAPSSSGIGKLPSDALPEGASANLSLGLSRSAEISFNELCRQLAYRNSGDGNNFDVMRLVYSLLTYVTTTNTLSGTAGIELVPGEGPMIGSVVGPSNVFLVKEALRVFFEEQNEDGLWDKGQPIYKSFRRTGRNVGNAFVFATDTVGSLLEALPADYFRPHMAALEKTLSWIEAHQVVEVIPNYCDPISLKCYGRSLRGWASPHLTPDTSAQAWSTAQTITCICRMRKVVRQLMHDDVLAEFGGISNPNGPRLDAWARLLDTDLGNPTKGICRTLKDVLDQRMVTPFFHDFSNPTIGAAYSSILFGPPGTAKTTICEALAERMGLDFLVIDTSTFLADGLTNVASRIRYVFDKLMELESCVILFDEIEEFCLDRETPGLGMESRMLTTAMLTAINDLRRKKRSIFFLATNRLRAFDSAITRPGRFDMQLFVGTPNLDARCIQFDQKLGGVFVEDDAIKDACQQYRSFLQKVWSQDAMFLNYLEGLQFASACADVVGSGNKLTDEIMDNILTSQAAVMTVRDTARDEYIASMELSRF